MNAAHITNEFCKINFNQIKKKKIDEPKTIFWKRLDLPAKLEAYNASYAFPENDVNSNRHDLLHATHSHHENVWSIHVRQLNVYAIVSQR